MEKRKGNLLDHFLVLEELYTWCTHNSSCLCYFRVFLNVNFNKMYILIKFIYDLPLEKVCLPKIKHNHIFLDMDLM